MVMWSWNEDIEFLRWCPVLIIARLKYVLMYDVYWCIDVKYVLMRQQYNEDAIGNIVQLNRYGKREGSCDNLSKIKIQVHLYKSEGKQRNWWRSMKWYLSVLRRLNGSENWVRTMKVILIERSADTKAILPNYIMAYFFVLRFSGAVSPKDNNAQDLWQKLRDKVPYRIKIQPISYLFSHEK